MDTVEAAQIQTETELRERREAEERGAAFLVWRDSGGRQCIFELGNGAGNVVIGRRVEADVRLNWDAEVSRLHAELEPKAGEWTVVDDGLSQNGTFVNGLRVEGRRRLVDGDVIQAGQTQLEFRSPRRDDTQATLVPIDRSRVLRFSDQQQIVLRALCRPLFGDGEGVGAADPVMIAAETGIPLDVVESEIDQLERTFGLEDLPSHERRAEIALLAVRSGVVGRGDYA
jgi:hypothetical protein